MSGGKVQVRFGGEMLQPVQERQAAGRGTCPPAPALEYLWLRRRAEGGGPAGWEASRLSRLPAILPGAGCSAGRIIVPGSGIRGVK